MFSNVVNFFDKIQTTDNILITVLFVMAYIGYSYIKKIIERIEDSYTRKQIDDKIFIIENDITEINSRLEILETAFINVKESTSAILTIVTRIDNKTS